MNRKKQQQQAGGCAHPPHRLYAGHTVHPITGELVLWVACCQCGQVIKPAVLEGVE